MTESKIELTDEQLKAIKDVVGAAAELNAENAALKARLEVMGANATTVGDINTRLLDMLEHVVKREG